MLLKYIPFSIFVLITLFHLYMGLGGRVNKDIILPKIKGQDLPFHSAAALPVAFLLGLSTLAYAQVMYIIPEILSADYARYFVILTGAALTFRGIFGLVFFHLLNMIIDPTPFKTWDLKLYSPLTIYLGVHCLIISM